MANEDNEDNEHYFLNCSCFNQSRRSLVDAVAEVLDSDIANLDSIALCSLFLYGSYNLTLVENRILVEATIDYIEKTNRLQYSPKVPGTLSNIYKKTIPFVALQVL